MQSPDPRPENRLTLEVRDGALRAELERLFRDDADVRFVGEDDDAPAAVQVVRVVDPDAADVVAIERMTDDDTSVVVVGDAKATKEAELVAAGASAVLDTDLPDAQLREQLVEVAEAEAEGGLDGPDAGGGATEPRLADFQSSNADMRDFVDLVRRIADTDSTLLVTGETGVGKERLARAIHAESSRQGEPFVSVNCGALPENLLESELFGHERGAFTGATGKRIGRFEEANGGTIFLDEIGEMPQHLQVKLLTVLQRREIRRLGSEAPHPIDVRVISATNRDLEEEIEAGRFREDLFFRLNVVSFRIPPLRERVEDLPQLVGRFQRHFAEVHGRPDVKRVDPRAMRALLDYPWPGNVRELVNVVERCVLLARGDRIALEDLPDAVLDSSGAEPDSRRDFDDELFALDWAEAKNRLLETFERRYLVQLLTETKGAVGLTAERAGVNPRTLYTKMRRFGLRKEDFAGDDD